MAAALVAALVVAVEEWAIQGGELPDHIDGALAALENRLVKRSRP